MSQLSRVSPKTVDKALDALLQWKQSKSKDHKPQLLEQDEFVYLILTLKKIPQNSRVNAHKILLPETLINPTEDSSELCLIIDDRSKSGLTKDDVAKKIKSENIPISKVIKLSKLKTDYRPFEAKRKLCDSYDMFFADRRVIPLLPKLLGKHFFKKKKIPVPLDLKHKNWKEQIENTCKSALLYFSTGTCSVVKVAKLSMESEGILANVMAAINGIAEVVPKKWGNIRSIHLKLHESLALPVYQAVPDLRLKIVTAKEKEEIVEEEKTAKVDENRDRTIAKESKKKGRMHEVRYMDSTVGEVMGEEEIGSEFEGEHLEDAEFGGKKKKKVETKNEKEARKVANVKKGGDAIKRKKGQEESGGEKEKKKSATKKLKDAEMKVSKKKKNSAAAK